MSNPGNESDLLGGTIEEYESLIVDVESGEGRDMCVNWDVVEDALVREGGWTENGARCVAQLARNYGSFVLRNALALAVAASVEDGALGL